MTRAQKAFRPIPHWHHYKISVHLGGVEKIRVSLHDFITMLINTLPALPNLSEFEDLHSGHNLTPAYDMKPFYRVGFAAFGSSLRKLVLHRDTDMFSEVLEDVPHLPCLQELRITFVYGRLLRDQEMQHIVAPFINRQRATIQTLSLHSLGVLDLSSLFLALGALPALQKLEIHIPPGDQSCPNQPGIGHFFKDHMGTLRHLTWDSIGGLKFGTRLSDNAITLSQLKTLCVRPTNDEDFQFVLVQCRCSVNSLTTLSMQGFPLSDGQVDSLVSIFSSPPARLVKLNIWIEVLRPQLILLLGEKLSGLKELMIYAHRIRPISATSVCFRLYSSG
jgi:hypothetical protein